MWVLHPQAGLVEKLEHSDIAAIWIYDILWLLFLDIVKMTAGAIWEKMKPASIDQNPALAAQQRKARRLSGALDKQGRLSGMIDKDDMKKRKASK